MTPLHDGAATTLANVKPKISKATRMRRRPNSPVRWRQSHTQRNLKRSDPKRELQDGYVPAGSGQQGTYSSWSALLGSLQFGFLVVCDCLHHTGEFEFLLILVVLLLFVSTFARMVAAPACKGFTPPIILAVDGFLFALFGCWWCFGPP